MATVPADPDGGHDEAAARLRWSELYHRHHRLVYRTCAAILRSHEDAEDAAQEIFGRLLTRPAVDIRDERRWLLEVTRNHCFDRRRAAARRPAVPIDAATRMQHPAADVEEHVIARGQVAWLLARLPRRQRQALTRHAVLDESLDTIAAELGVSYHAAAQLIVRARHVLDGVRRSGRAAIGACGASRAAWRRLRWRVAELLDRPDAHAVLHPVVAISIAVIVITSLLHVSTPGVQATTGPQSGRAEALGPGLPPLQPAAPAGSRVAVTGAAVQGHAGAPMHRGTPAPPPRSTLPKVPRPPVVFFHLAAFCAQTARGTWCTPGVEIPRPPIP